MSRGAASMEAGPAATTGLPARKPHHVVVTGPVPPPYYGSCIALQQVLEPPAPPDLVLHHLDATRSHFDGFGRITAEKLGTDVANLLRIRPTIRRVDGSLFYLMLSQVPLGLIRDLIFAALARSAGARVLVHLHGSQFRTMFGRLNPVVQRVLRPALRRLDGVVVLDESLRSQFDGLVAPDRLHVVRNGVPETLFPEREVDAARQDRLRPGPLRVLYLSNLQPLKGFPDLVEALAGLRERGVDFRATLAGLWEEPELEPRTRARVRELGLERHCSFPGVVTGEGKRRLLLQSDVFVLPTRLEEGQPLSIIEAYAAGLPVISTRMGGIPAMVEEDRTGFLLDPGDRGALERRLEDIASDREAAVAMGAAGRALFLREFTSAGYRDSLFRVFRDVIAAGEAAPC